MPSILDHETCIKYLCDHLTRLGMSFSVTDPDLPWDIELSNPEGRIKIFPRRGSSRHLARVPKKLEVRDDVLYLVVSPTRNNHLGYTAVGGFGKSFEIAVRENPNLKTLDDVDLTKLGHINLKKRFTGEKAF